MNVLCEAKCEKPSSHLKDIEQIKTQLNGIHQDRYRGAVVRARSEKNLLGEQPARRALADEREYALSKERREIEYKNMVTSNENSIKEAFVHHYRTLFSDSGKNYEREEVVNYLACLPKLDDEIRERLEQSIPVEVA